MTNNISDAIINLAGSVVSEASLDLTKFPAMLALCFEDGTTLAATCTVVTTTRPMTQMEMSAERVANKTSDAYSYPTYGEVAWLRAATLLLEGGWSELETEAILRSKWTRWASDQADPTGSMENTGEEIITFMNDRRNNCTQEAVAQLVAGTFPEENKS